MKTTIKPDLLEQVRTTPGNRLSLIAIGPIPQVLPGETVNFVLGVVAARKYGSRPSTVDDELSRTTLYDNLGWAHRGLLHLSEDGACLLQPGETGDFQ